MSRTKVVYNGRYGGGFSFSKRDAYKAAFDKLQKYEEKFK